MNEFMTSIAGTLAEFSLDKGLRVIGAIIVLIVGFKLIDTVLKKFGKTKAAEKSDPTLRNFIHLMLNYSLKIILIISVATMIGVPTTSMIALIGSAGLAIGLALQGSLTNIAGGFLIFSLRPFSVGDFITFGDKAGTVEQINLFYTHIITVDNRRIIVPNGALSNDTIVNASAFPTRRIDVSFSVSYSTDMSMVHAVILDAVKRNPLILADPEPILYLKEQADSALIFELRAWCKTSDYKAVSLLINELGKRALDKAKIEIPFPQLDVHIINTSPDNQN